MAALALLFLLCTAVSAEVWPNPKFSQPKIPNNPGNVVLTCDNDNNCWSTIDENVAETLYIAKLTYTGNTEANVKELTTNYLNPEIKVIGKDQYIVTSKSQDYETIGDLKINLKITIGSDFAYFYLFVRDINNHKPILSVEDQTCPVKENFSGQTSCTIMLEDVDTVCDDFHVQVFESGIPSDIFSPHVTKTGVHCNKYIALVVQQELDYESKMFYRLDINVTDGPYDKSQRLVIEVQDEPDEPPEWRMRQTVTLVEEVESEIQLIATDGDLGVNDKLTYSINVDEDYFEEYFMLDPDTGIVKIKAIDRESPIFSNISNIFYITATAYDTYNQSSITLQIVVIDINDNSPKIDPCGLTMEFDEMSFYTSDGINIKDMDEAKNGTYKVYLEDYPGKNFIDIFRVIPDVGYQQSSFNISVVKSNKLDYENEEMKKFTFKLVAEELMDKSHVEKCNVTVILKDVIDEDPKFTNTNVDQYVNENAPDGTKITTLTATDKDHGDELRYSTTSTSVRVDGSSGVVTAIGQYDYETQENMTIQVSVHDKANNSDSMQLVLHINDENDTPPKIFMPFGRVEVSESYPEGYVSTEIRATDLDNNAELQFHINWDKSSATQQGAQSNRSVFEGTFAMNDSCGCDKGEYKACSCLQIAKKLDWIEMDTLYLDITVTDINTIVNSGDASALLVVLINDTNNHEPKFEAIEELYVTENTTSGIKIGSVIAKDEKDGPKFNHVTYKLEEINGTLPNLVDIDPESGVLTVKENNQIDYETYQEMYYTVTATDGDFYPKVNITINVRDRNDNPPRIIKKKDPDPIDEFSQPGIVFKVESEDDDLSEPFNTPTYTFDSRVDKSLFYIDNATGVISTLKPLDYLNGAEYTLWILVRDNYLNHDDSGSLSDSGSITVRVKDVNNHRPEFQEPKECEANPQETEQKDSFIVKIQANDQDDEADFKDVLYSITNIVGLDDAKEPPKDLFKIDEATGIIVAGMNLSGYIVKYNVTVMGRNRDTVTPQNNTETFTICVQDINDHYPTITFPSVPVIQLRKKQKLYDTLYLYTDEELPSMAAFDEDKGKNAEVDFSMKDAGSGSADVYFTLTPDDTSSANLTLKKSFNMSERQFEIIITATDRGVPPLPTSFPVTIQVLTDGNPPYFEKTTDTTTIKENDPNAYYSITPAKDDDNKFKDGCEVTSHYIQEHYEAVHLERNPARSSYKSNMECDEIIYSIKTEGNEDNIFFIDKNVLKLNTPLDFEKNPKYLLKIAATNKDGKEGSSSVLDLTIEVQDENDNFPEFERKSYAEGIGTGDNNGKIIQQFIAKDDDKDDGLTYGIVEGSRTANDSLKSHLNDLDLHPTGELILKFSPDNTMSGYFSFQIFATDEVGHNDTADVRVFIISDSNRQKFVFGNHKSYVDQKIHEIEDIFSKYVGYNCTVELPIIEGYSYTQELNRTYVTAHFIDPEESLPVENSVTGLLINEKKMTIGRELLQYTLNWLDVNPEDKTSDDGEDQSALTQTVLIVVSALLATLVLLLLATFFFKIRSYNHRLEALSQTKFGSQDSGLNRVNMNVPNTNQHALEGSNPVWNEELDNEDNISQGSGDSELVGVEDNPEFSPQNHRMEARRGSKNPIFDDIENEKEWSSVEFSPDINMNEEKNPNFSFGPPTTNVPTTEL